MNENTLKKHQSAMMFFAIVALIVLIAAGLFASQALRKMLVEEIICEDKTALINNIFILIHGLFTCAILFIIVILRWGYRISKENYKRLAFLAYRDDLTKLYNRTGFLACLEDAQSQYDSFSLAAINIRQFKFINEMFGHEHADHLLCFVAKIIHVYLKDGEFACRVIGDNFYLFLKESDKEMVKRRIDMIIERIEGASVDKNTSFQLRLYSGCVIKAAEDQIDTNSLMTHLVFTLSKAKELKNEKIYFYDNKLYEKMKIESYVESHMYQALAEGEFHMYLQPKHDLHTGKLCGAEALVRWVTKEGQCIYPDQFIPLFEKNGFCAKLDLYMLECACRQIQNWMDMGIEPIGISVNQTKLLFYDPHYIDKIDAIMSRYSVSPKLITLEILEGLVSDNLDEINHKIYLLKKRGFKISMDDFGSGYSSLNVLSKLRIDELKIDREFLKEMECDAEHRAEIVLRQVIYMTKELKILTVVEGVETHEQESFVSGLGCDHGQGYLYSPPIPKEQFHESYMAAYA